MRRPQCFFLCLAFIILLFSNREASAQKKSIRFQQYTKEDGLLQNLVDCILQDSKGFMWFGTWNGLSRFDGYEFRNFRQQDKVASSLINNIVYDLCEDSYGNIWIATNKGLGRYLYAADSFDEFIPPDGEHPRSNRATAVVKDHEGFIWAAFQNKLYKLRTDPTGRTRVIKSYAFGGSQELFSASVINHLMVDRKNQLWISTDNGLTVMDTKTGAAQTLRNEPGNQNSLPYNLVKSCFEDSEGLIWIASESGLCKYDTDNLLFKRYFHDEGQKNSLAHSYCMSIAEDVNGNILIGTFGGLSIYNKDGSDNFRNYQEDPYSEYSLSNNFVNCVYSDKNGIIWIGTERGGINKYNSSRTELEYFENEVDNPNSINNNVINSILEDERNIWIGTAGGGLNRYRKESGKFEHYTFSNPSSRYRIANFVSELHRDMKGTLWVGTWGSGIYKLINENTATEQFINFSNTGSANGLINNYVSSIRSDSLGRLWIGTYEGLCSYDPQKNAFYPAISSTEKINMRHIGCLLFDHEQKLWVGTREEGLFRISTEKEGKVSVLKHFAKSDGDPASISDNYITAIFEDSEKRIWIGTYGYGLNQLVSETSGGTFKTLTMDDGLSDNIIYRILEDNAGDLWITTEYGLSQFNTVNGLFRNFYKTDGFQNNQYYWNAACRSKDGKIYLGGMNGVNAFYPDSSFFILNRPLKVTITDFKISGKTVRPGEEIDRIVVLNKSIQVTEQLEISYQSNDISFEFSALDYDQSSTISYAYQLEGFEKKWNLVSADRRFAIYTNLDPGKYTFRVKATGINGKWDGPVREMSIEIVPPFWATWWFRIMVVFTLVLITVAFYRYRVISLKLQKRKLEKQVHERTSKIEKQKEELQNQNKHIQRQRDKLVELNRKVKAVNESKLKFFTSISHEFKTPLTLILGPIKSILGDSKLSLSSRNSASLIDKNARRLLHLINQLMDFRKLEQGKTELRVSRVDINELLNDITLSFSSLSNQKNIDLSYIPVPAPGETWVDIQKMEIILYNLLSNSFKNSHDGDSIEVALKPDPKNSKNLLIQVTDTGIGIEKENLKYIFDRFYQVKPESPKNYGTGIGLSLTRDLIEKHRGTITVESEPGVGTCFTIAIPVSKGSFDPTEISDSMYQPGSIKDPYLDFPEENGYPDSSAVIPLPAEKTRDRSTVLVVEDNQDLRKFVRDNLQAKYHILEAENGAAAFELASREFPTVVISDVMMPVMDGLEFCKKIKSELLTSHIPVILLTAKGEIEDIIEGLDMGADRYIAKPFSIKLLEAHINSLIESRRKLFQTFRLQENIDTKILATTSTDEDFLINITKLIMENLDNPELNVSFIAQKLLISRGHLYTKLISLANLSPIDFLNTIRLKKSIELLKQKQNTISEVAFAVGFTDPKYFSRLFKKQFGRPPSEYLTGQQN
ncbi:MAG: response regulator [Bacteroidales bacterium]|nr:response regulator [Bacteroidales bacterium]